jgi:hypothetical protein
LGFAEPPAPVEGRYGRLLAVRDLASGYQLAKVILSWRFAWRQDSAKQRFR